MIPGHLSRRAGELRAARTPFVVATVVRAQRPTSVHSGDAALVLGDGTIEGFVGGACAEQSVRLHALRALETGDGVLLRILPGDDDAPAAEGAVTVQNPCLSGGSLEIFLEPILAAPRLVVLGETPIAAAVARLGADLDLEVASGADAAPAEGDLALVVAAHGRDELPALRHALGVRIPYVGLVASRVRGDAVKAELRAEGVDEERVAALETPAGIDIGARTPEEVALSILARVVAVRRAANVVGVRPLESAPLKGSDPAVDPVCGMAVAAAPGTPHIEHEGRTVYFCCDGCRAAFERDPARFVAAH
ncbi:MAG TPA: XdhC family protein [Solirubrobacteraceae bacterium]|nr:XdhC family protein [Solirubrobacteraceae bacterium]